jgi:hypothetical protein
MSDLDKNKFKNIEGQNMADTVIWRLNAGSVQSQKHRRDVHC